MIRNLKTMALALFAVCALGALGAQSASAVVTHEFTSSADSTVLTGTTEPGTKEFFTLTNAKVECQDVTYRGFQSGKEVDHVAVFPIYNDITCKINNAINAHIDNNGCTFTFDSDTFENPTHYGAGPTHANVSLACEHTGSITVTSAGCIVHVGTTHTNGVVVNHNLPGIRYTELPNHAVTGKTALTVNATVRTIRAETTGANCPLLGLGTNGTHINGTYEGKAEVTCYEGDVYNPHLQVPNEKALVNCGLSTP